MGRPKIDYSPELAKEICYVVSCSSKGIKKLCKLNKHWPSHDTIYHWLTMEKEFSDLYARAKRQQIEVIIDEILDIADDTSKDNLINEDGKSTIDHEHISRSRLKIDTRKWLAAKLCPRLYGDKEELVSLKFPDDIKNANALLPMSAEVFRALANQEMTPAQARSVIGAIKDYSATIVIGDLNSRLAQLENTA